MRPILAGIHELFQHVCVIKDDPAIFRPDKCPHCGQRNPHCHGFYSRKADRENSGQSNLNPIWIYRFYCSACKRTCSVLPECIPQYRWYLWKMQQTALFLYCSGLTYKKISQQLSPSRWTISRWIRRFKSQFNQHAPHLKSQFSWLGYTSGFIEFWQTYLSKKRLSTAMMLLKNLGIAIP